MSESIDARPSRLTVKVHRDIGYRALQVVSSLAFLGVLWTAGFYAYWRWIDPVLPDVKVIKAEIHELDLRHRRVANDRIFEVIRVLESPVPVEATLHAYFERPPLGQELEYIDNRPVVRDRTQYAVPPTRFTMEAGIHRRDRLWEVPAGLEPGDYVYRAELRACNPVRCVTRGFPPLQVTLR